MLIDASRQVGHTGGELRQRCGVALGQLPNAAGERLRDAVQFALHAGGQGGQPLVIHHQRLDLLDAELWVLVVSQLVERRVGLLDLGPQGRPARRAGRGSGRWPGGPRAPPAAARPSDARGRRVSTSASSSAASLVLAFCCLIRIEVLPEGLLLDLVAGRRQAVLDCLERQLALAVLQDGDVVTGIARRAMKVLDHVIHAVQTMHQPVIAAINGPAIGGGFCLSMICDIRIASEEALFRAAGINNGLTAAELGLSYTLPRAIGSSKAFEIMLTGRDVKAEEAERVGIVSKVVKPEQLLEECYTMAEKIMGYSQLGVELTKQMLWAGQSASSLQTHINHEGHAQLYVRMTTKNFERRSRRARKNARPSLKINS